MPKVRFNPEPFTPEWAAAEFEGAGVVTRHQHSCVWAADELNGTNLHEAAIVGNVALGKKILLEEDEGGDDELGEDGTVVVMA